MANTYLSENERNNFITLMNTYDKLPPREQDRVIWFIRGLLAGSQDRVIDSTRSRLKANEAVACSIDIEVSEKCPE